MIEFEISKKLLADARKRADLQKSNKFTFSDDGKLYGIIAEMLFLEHFGGELKNTKHYDIVLGAHKIDIKTKSCKDKPKENYTASVSDYQKNHESDAYFFFRVSKDLKLACAFGGMLKKEFYEKAELVKAGTRDGGFVCRVDMWSIEISKLVEPTKFVKDLK